MFRVVFNFVTTPFTLSSLPAKKIRPTRKPNQTIIRGGRRFEPCGVPYAYFVKRTALINK